MNKKLYLGVALISVLSLLAIGWATPKEACAAQPAPAPGQHKPETGIYDKELVVLMEGFSSEGAFPHLGGGVALQSWRHCYDFLLYRDHETGEATVPGLAERVEVSDDMLTYTFHLRKGIQFHGGWGELTAEDVIFTFEMAIREHSICGVAGKLRKEVLKVEALDDYTVKFTRSTPDWAFFNDFSNHYPFMGIVSKKYVKTVGEEKANLHPIGTGPYKFIKRLSGEYIKFEAVPNHWRVTPDFRWLTLKAVAEESTRIAMLKTGMADITPITIERIPEVEKAGFRHINNKACENCRVVLASSPLADHPAFDPSLPWWADPKDQEGWGRALKVRKALNLAVDKERINETIALGTGALYGVPNFLAGEPGWDPSWEPYPYDPEQAKKLLAEAGYPDGFKVTVYLVKYPGKPLCADMMEAVSIYWEAIGISVKRRPIDWAQLRPLMYDRKVKNPWVICAGWDDGAILSIYNYNSSFNAFSTAAHHTYLDALAKQGYAETDPEKRAEITRKWGQFYYDNYLSVPIVCIYKNWALSSRVGEWPVIYGIFHDSQNLEYVTYRP